MYLSGYIVDKFIKCIEYTCSNVLIYGTPQPTIENKFRKKIKIKIKMWLSVIRITRKDGVPTLHQETCPLPMQMAHAVSPPPMPEPWQESHFFSVFVILVECE